MTKPKSPMGARKSLWNGGFSPSMLALPRFQRIGRVDGRDKPGQDAFPLTASPQNNT
jgi:hypothetical protein